MSVVVYDDFKSACENGDLETVMKLFDKFNVEFESDMLKIRDLVVEQGNLNILEYFYRRGVDFQTFNGYETLFTIAARRGWVDIVEFLLEKGEDINLQNNIGWTVLMHTSESGNVDIEDRLLLTY